MVMSNRLAVMNEGKIEQLGSPEEVYERPCTDFVASFLGASNLIGARVVERRASGYAQVKLDGGGVVSVPGDRLPQGRDTVKVGVRPEKVRLQASAGEAELGHNSLTGKVVSASYLGVSHQYTIDGPGGATVTVYVQNLGASHPPVLGETVRLVWLPDHTFVV